MNSEINNDLQRKEEMCKIAKQYMDNKDFDLCKEFLCQSMQEFPSAPEPHNLFGIMLEKMGEHKNAMRHFRAAWDLDPTYAPAKENLLYFGTFQKGPYKYFYGI